MFFSYQKSAINSQLYPESLCSRDEKLRYPVPAEILRYAQYDKDQDPVSGIRYSVSRIPFLVSRIPYPAFHSNTSCISVAAMLAFLIAIPLTALAANSANAFLAI